MNKNPTFTIYTGPMFGSKTTRLIADIDRLKYKKKTVLVLKPSIDKRYDNNFITSHSSIRVPAFCVDSGSQITDLVENTFGLNEKITIAVDEAFMIKGIDNCLIDLYKKGHSIIISTIQLDANEIPFDNIKNLMPFATKIEVCPAVCTMCDCDAYFTAALFEMSGTSQEDRLGSNDKYEPRCFKHYKFYEQT
jgi:thymidine kinase